MKKLNKIDNILSDKAIKVLEHQEKIMGGANPPIAPPNNLLTGTWCTTGPDLSELGCPDTSVGANNCIPIVNDDSCTCPDD